MKLLLILSCLLLAGCSGAAQTVVEAPAHISTVDGFIVTGGDIAHRPYDLLGLVTVTVSKPNLFSKTRDRRLADAKLMEKAKLIGADAVIRVIYSPTRMSGMSWSGIKAEGMAIRYKPSPK